MRLYRQAETTTATKTTKATTLLPRPPKLPPPPRKEEPLLTFKVGEKVTYRAQPGKIVGIVVREIGPFKLDFYQVEISSGVYEVRTTRAKELGLEKRT